MSQREFAAALIHDAATQRDLPTGTVTFLFTDVEGSTRLLHELGAEDYAEALAEHRRVLREAFADHGGVEVDTQGDSFFFAFPTAPGALEAAGRATEALSLGPIRVRIGLHTGTPHLAEEGYVGTDVHRAARVAAAGHGGQVLVSAPTVSLLGTDGLSDLGEHRLKDLAAPERLWQLGEAKFPPLRSLYRTNLPIPATPFLGRQGELAAIRGLLELEGASLITLTGPGGTGKTRLALQAAAESAESFPDGVFWVPLAPLRDPELVLPAIEQALGTTSTLTEHVRDKRMLLLLDNLEQVADAAPALADVLARCPNVRLLVTSRALLRIGAEQEYAVPALPSVDAVSLFHARAGAVGPEDVVLEICRRLDGLPLAIELAAARTRVLAPEQLLGRLEQRLPLLTGGPRDAPERQRTLRATISWSFDLLSAEEKQLVSALAVFAGGFDVAAAEVVCGADLVLLESLVEQNLIRRWEPDRLGMLETIREFALEQLEESGEGEDLRRRHAEYFLKIAERAALELTGSGQAAWERRLEAEIHNLRAAFAWAECSSNATIGLRLAAALWRFWVGRAFVSEGQRFLERALRQSDDGDPRLRAKVLEGLCFLERMQGRAEEAKELGEQSVAIWRTTGGGSGLASSLNTLAVANFAAGDYGRANVLLEESSALARELGDTWALANSLLALGNVRHHEAEYEDARLFHTQSLDLQRLVGDRHGEARSLFGLGFSALVQGRLRDARAHIHESMELAHAVGDTYIVMWCLEAFAALAAVDSEVERAACILGAAERMRTDLGVTLAIHVARDLHEPAVLGVTEALDQAAIQLMAEGRAMTPEEAVSYALFAEQSGVHDHVSPLSER